jgi:hypothetical protein
VSPQIKKESYRPGGHEMEFEILKHETRVIIFIYIVYLLFLANIPRHFGCKFLAVTLLQT